MGCSFVAHSTLRDMMLETVRMAAPSCEGLVLVRVPGPFWPQNWRISTLDVLAHDYSATRDKTDELQAMRHWICVPDDHPLDGQVFG